MKIIAFYLPQFHAIPENDEWWGKGFTDWINVKKSRSIFKGQKQPRVPLNDYYYDLSRHEDIDWQAKLARKYNIYGWCIYHYWFNGKLLLEKPAEILFRHKEIDINFCFSWANETWSRTWTGKSRQILIEQTYGGMEEWISHFNYLLPFFKDKRYIKEQNKPMFVIYKSGSIPSCREMMECWDNLAKDNGFDGMHFVETLNRGVSENRELPFSAKVEFEPSSIKQPVKLLRVRIRRHIVRIINKYLKTRIPEVKKRLFSDEISRIYDNVQSEGTYAGAFMGWDNSPRRDLAATYITSPTKQEFKEYLKYKLDLANRVYKTEYIFVNAWNEWAEGTYLEPDIHNGYTYLEAISETLKEFA